MRAAGQVGFASAEFSRLRAWRSGGPVSHVRCDALFFLALAPPEAIAPLERNIKPDEFISFKGGGPLYSKTLLIAACETPCVLCLSTSLTCSRNVPRDPPCIVPAYD